ncbi:MAG: hypothetical protein JWO19_2377 [Bryobacterales bacterium]|nr:hypothetical protein [Bryobacterales bacterium]
MLCFLCGKKIGLCRKLVDQQYCSSAHRKEARLASAQAFREEDDLEHWSTARSKDKKKGSARPHATAGQTASVFAFLTVGGLLVAALLLPGPGPGAAFPQVSLDPSIKRGLVARAGDAVGELVRSQSPITLHHEFRSGFADWVTVNSRGAANVDDSRDWVGASRAALSHPIALRLWQRSSALQNYQMEFQGQMEGHSLSWAFRASNGNNFYASKLVIARPGTFHNAGLVHYAVIDGRETGAVRLPLPVSLERGVNYRVRMTVQDDHFITYLNGQVISSWSDSVLKRGGVGFFEDQSDPQKVAWVSLSERDSFMGRMLAHFSLFVIPGRE